MTDEERHFLSTHDAHDFEALRSRWEGVCREAGLVEQTLSMEAGYPVHAYQTRAYEAGDPDRSPIYLCAGVHGDEPAPVWGMLAWAESHLSRLSELSALILPCFNPWGLVNNRRSDQDGRDLNRLFHATDISVMQAWRKAVGDSSFAVAIQLHEDYDARGTYVYELTQPDQALAEVGLKATDAIIPREPRDEFEGNVFERGILRRTEEIERAVEEELDGGYPEAIYTYLHHAPISLTFETPSEYSLWDRVRAQAAFIQAVISEID